jgi:hypothetical protein
MHAYGLNPISFTEIEAYGRLLRKKLSPEEVALIRIADSAALEQIAKNGTRKEQE